MSVLDSLCNQQTKRKKRKRRSNPCVYNPILQDIDHVNKDDYLICGGSRRNRYYLDKEAYLKQILIAFEKKQFTIKPNPFHMKAQSVINAKQNKTKMYMYHSGPFQVLIKTIIIKGVNRFEDNIPVDICGIKEKKSINAFVYSDKKLGKMLDYYILLHSKTHVGCLIGTCFNAFSKISETNAFVVCPDCGTKQCINCQVDYKVHAGLNCAEYKHQTEMVRLKDPMILKELFTGHMQACPKCMEFSVKIEGCNRMQCNKCGEYWCWACGMDGLNTKWHGLYDHYKADPNYHKGKDGNQKRCIAGGEFTENVKDYIIAKNAERYPDQWDAYNRQADSKLPSARQIVFNKQITLPEFRRQVVKLPEVKLAQTEHLDFKQPEAKIPEAKLDFRYPNEILKFPIDKYDRKRYAREWLFKFYGEIGNIDNDTNYNANDNTDDNTDELPDLDLID